MASDISLLWEGVNGFEHRLTELPMKLNQASRQAVAITARMLKDDARANAPVGPSGPRAEGGPDKNPGRLRRSISYTTPKAVGPFGFTSYVRARAPYSVKVEKKEPYFRPAHAKAAAAMRGIHASAWSRALS